MKFLRHTIILLLIAVGLTSAASAQDTTRDIAPCTDGMADGTYPCDNIDLLSLEATNQAYSGNGNDVWGWTDPGTGQEWALQGHDFGATITDVSDPLNPVYVGYIPSTTGVDQVWRDLKIYDHYLYIVSDFLIDTPHGMQIFDLHRLRTLPPLGPVPLVLTADALYTGVGRSHNVVINEDTGFAYIVGAGSLIGTGCSGGLHIVDLKPDPLSPTFVGCYDEDGYTHDAQCVIYNGLDTEHNGKEICFNSNEDTLTIVDVTDKSDMQMLARVAYTNAEYAHQGWLTEDHAYFLLGDELDEDELGVNTTTFIFDLSDLDNPTFVPYVHDNTSIDHNLYVRENCVYQANYTSGLRVFALDDLANGNLIPVAHFDTFPDNDNPTFDGVWSVFPYFTSKNIILSGDPGLFSLRLSPEVQEICDVEPPIPFISNCIDNLAALTYPCENIKMLSLEDTNQAYSGSGNDIWGWTDPETGNEYALQGHDFGTTITDITNPLTPNYLGYIPTGDGVNLIWRDLKVYQNYLYIVADFPVDTLHGMQIFDLTRLRTVPTTELLPIPLTPDNTYTGIGRAHNIVINEDSGYAYAVGAGSLIGTGCSGGLHVIDLNVDPVNPTFVGCYDEDGYTHDAQCVIYNGLDTEHNGKEICLNSNEDTLTIVDVSDKSNMTQISRTGYSNVGYTHQGWLTDDHAYFLLGDETDEQDHAINTTTIIWDLTDLDNPTFVPFTHDNTAIDHNLYIRDNCVYQANYTSGLRVFSLEDLDQGMLNPVAYFDTFPDNDNPSFDGVWSVYPYFESKHIALSDGEGLFTLQLSPTQQAICDGGTVPLAVGLETASTNDVSTYLWITAAFALLLGFTVWQRRSVSGE